MKKRLQKIGEEIVPLSRKQRQLLFLLIACVFQFLFFYTPALAAEAVASPDNQDSVISLGDVSKSPNMDINAQKIVNEMVSTSTKAVAPATATSTVPKTIKKVKAPVKVKSTSVHKITAYNSDVSQTDGSPCTTANGFNVCQHNQEDTIAANFLKFGTKVKIPDLFGDKVFVVRDRMSAKHANRVDVWMKNRQSAIKFGVKVAKIQVVE
jgi:3D (Asp-Asp-Asp) domain-containing protein